MNRIKTAIISLVLSLAPITLLAQLPAVHQQPEARFREGMDLFSKEKYSAAREVFFDLMHQPQVLSYPALRAEAAYHEALCALELFNQDSRDRLLDFIDQHANNNHTNMVKFNLGRSEYQKRHYRAAIKHFEEVDTRELKGEMKAEYHFKKGYAHLSEEAFDAATREFAKVKDSRSRYAPPVNYYYAHLAYIKGDYQTALEGFSRIASDPNFKKIVPHYQIQIYYGMKDWAKVQETGPGLVAEATGNRKAEFARMTGDAFFYEQQYKEAIPWLKIYIETPGMRASREDQYQLGIACYHDSDLGCAEKSLQKAAGAQDSLAQNALYHLGHIYVLQDQKKFAWNAFREAYKIGLDKQIKEDALFNYAKLSYELSYNPYNEAIDALKTYIKEYPQSARLDEANGYLVDLFLSTRNYTGALEALDNIQKKTPDLLAAYQKISYYRGTELFLERKYGEAIQLWIKSLEYEGDKSLKAETHYWLGEAWYLQKQYDRALQYYNLFLTMPGAFSSPLYKTTPYNAAYAHFHRKEYDKASTEFRRFLRDPGQADNKMKADAAIRTGDCFFIRKSYEQSIGFYNQGLDLNVLDQDYATYQKAMALGVMDRIPEKIKALQDLVDRYPRSPYRDDALYELGSTYLVLNQNEQALRTFRQVTQEYKGSEFDKKGLLKIGLLQFNASLDDQALVTFKKVVNDYPGTPEATEALNLIRNIYVEIDRTDEFFKYAENVPFAKVSNREQDSLVFLAAENQYLNGNRLKALEGFNNYLDRFPNGKNRIPALFYRSESLYMEQKASEALSGYEEVANSNSTFMETALLRAAEISYNLQDCEKAMMHYDKLRSRAQFPANILTAWIGLMRCRHQLNQSQGALEAASEVLRSDKAAEKLLIEAHFISGKSYFALGDTLSAQREFRITHKLSAGAMGAEAKYFDGLFQFKQGQVNLAEKTVFDLIERYPSQDHWIAKAFLLLSDIYVSQDNIFQARQTLQSIIDNHEGSGPVKEAKEKLAALDQKQRSPDGETEKKNGETDFDDLF